MQVKDRAIKWLESVTPEACAGWCRKARREEDDAREKEGLDRPVARIAPVIVDLERESDSEEEDLFAAYYDALERAEPDSGDSFTSLEL